jgi:hypothetical protein
VRTVLPFLPSFTFRLTSSFSSELTLPVLSPHSPTLPPALPRSSPLDLEVTSTSSTSLVAASLEQFVLLDLPSPPTRSYCSILQQPSPSSFLHLRRSTQLVASTITGSISLLDTRTPHISTGESVLAHTGGISQLEVEGNYIVSVGYTMRFVLFFLLSPFSF